MNKKEIGNLGEDLAVRYLEQLDYRIIERNFECRQGEIDIIAMDQKKKELVFIEVKTRRSFLYGNPIDAVSDTKKKHMIKAVKYYLYRRNLEQELIRLDVIEIYLGKQKYKVNHVKQII